jgi:asparagine synthetase B (glutamine-hydrolysing)
VVGIHNGIILNDDELLEPHSCARCEPRMTVDSEAIFALAAHSQNDPRALEELTGSMAAAWLDARVAGTIFAARGVGRPLWIGKGRHELFFASTKAALEVVERYAGVRLRKREIGDGTFLRISAARITREERLRPDRAPGRARAGRGRLLPRAPRGARGCIGGAAPRRLPNPRHLVLEQPGRTATGRQASATGCEPGS